MLVYNRYKPETGNHKLSLVLKGKREDSSKFDIYFCYVHGVDTDIEEIGAILEDEG